VIDFCIRVAGLIGNDPSKKRSFPADESIRALKSQVSSSLLGKSMLRVEPTFRRRVWPDGRRMAVSASGPRGD
jgi:hypothetical protein